MSSMGGISKQVCVATLSRNSSHSLGWSLIGLLLPLQVFCLFIAWYLWEALQECAILAHIINYLSLLSSLVLAWDRPILPAPQKRALSVQGPLTFIPQHQEFIIWCTFTTCKTAIHTNFFHASQPLLYNIDQITVLFPLREIRYILQFYRSNARVSSSNLSVVLYFKM